jgi:YHS domain-containing protein
MAIDPVCNMDVDTDTSEFQSMYAGKRYFFCSEECKSDFDERPEEYIAASAAA